MRLCPAQRAREPDHAARDPLTLTDAHSSCNAARRKTHPYDPEKDSVLKRVRKLAGDD